MRLKTLLTLVGFCIIVMVQGCENENELQQAGSIDAESTISHMVVMFDNKTYETDVKTLGDSIIYLNQEFAEIYDSKISKLPELATVMTEENGVTYVEYLTSQSEVENKYKFMNLKNDTVDNNVATTRSKVIELPITDPNAIIIAYAELYDDKNFKDTMLKTYASNLGYTGHAKFKDLGFNDKCSSIKVFNTMISNYKYRITYVGGPNDRFDLEGINVFYGRELRPVLVGHEHTNYGGKILYCIAPQAGSSDNHFDSNLRKIGWNDKISSVEWTIVLNDNLGKLLNGQDSGVKDHGKC